MATSLLQSMQVWVETDASLEFVEKGGLKWSRKIVCKTSYHRQLKLFSILFICYNSICFIHLAHLIIRYPCHPPEVARFQISVLEPRRARLVFSLWSSRHWVTAHNYTEVLPPRQHSSVQPSTPENPTNPIPVSIGMTHKPRNKYHIFQLYNTYPVINKRLLDNCRSKGSSWVDSTSCVGDLQHTEETATCFPGCTSALHVITWCAASSVQAGLLYQAAARWRNHLPN